ncbi:uncharacterized protein LOC129577987 [Sitodiplosis mosellana]|uniref:uncharacterized protein LOC129577987 n=1 Tax=Sitodiplosis mosellana TaxID=263140 RepID=UPI002444F7C6|nr:uncharacterized protein LOC129577987 [Sitodiplosis mosellana]
MSGFPHNLLTQYEQTSNKLKKIQRIVFKRFAPNVSEVSEEFQRLAAQFFEGGMPEYAALCYDGASKCEKALNNPIFERHLLLKAARAYREADANRLCLRSNTKPYTQGALSCYHRVITQSNDNSAMKAAVIREMKEINPNYEVTSNFVSPAHRAQDLDLAANECITNGNFESALEKITEICDDIVERKVEDFYEDILGKHEITLILLILLLEYPSARQSPSNVKLYEYFANGGYQHESYVNYQRHSRHTVEVIKSLIEACKCQQYTLVYSSEIPSLAKIPGLTHHQKILLEKLKEKFYNLL